MKEQRWHKIEARFGLRMPKNPYNNLLFDHIDGFEFFKIFWVPTLSYLPLLQEGTIAEFPALGSSHNRPCCPLRRCNCPQCISSQGVTWNIEDSCVDIMY